MRYIFAMAGKQRFIMWVTGVHSVQTIGCYYEELRYGINIQFSGGD